MSTYQVRIAGVDVTLTVVDSGITSDSEDILGDARYTFGPEVAALLAPMRLVQYNGLGEASEQTLAESVEDTTGEAWNPDDSDGALVLGVDAGIGAVALLLSRGEAFAFEVDTTEGGDFWALHDLVHADLDVEADWAEGYADFAPVGAWAEDRANIEGARLALRAGVALDSVLGSLVDAGKALAERFKGEVSTALDDLLDGGFEFLPDALRDSARFDVARVEREVAECAALILDDTGHDDLDLDGLQEIGTEVGEESTAHIPSGLILAHLRDFDDLGDCYGKGEDGPDLDARASYAFGRAVCARLDSLARCPECDRGRIVRGSDRCADCAAEDAADAAKSDAFDAYLESKASAPDA